MLINANKDGNLRAGDLKEGDKMTIEGVDLELKSSKGFTKGFTTPTHYTEIDGFLLIELLRNGLEVWREEEPKQVTFNTTLVADGGYVRLSNQPEYACSGLNAGVRVRVAVEELRDGTEGS